MGSSVSTWWIWPNVRLCYLPENIVLNLDFSDIVRRDNWGYYLVILYFGCSYAEMEKEEKNKISHRYKSLALVKSHFKEAGYVFQTDDGTI